MSAVDAVNRLITSGVDVALAPLASAPAAALVLASVVLGVAMSLSFKWTSNQAALRRLAEQSRAEVLGLRLFRESLGVAARAQGRLLGLVARRLLHAVPPMLVMTLPLVILLAQLAARYEHRPLRPGETAIVTVTLAPEAFAERLDAIALELPPALRRQTPPLRTRRDGTVAWRVGVERASTASVRVTVGERALGKRVIAAEDASRLVALNEVRGRGVAAWALHPAEETLPRGGPVRRIEVTYPRRETAILGTTPPWWLTLLVVSMLTAIAVRPLLRVQF